MFSHALKPTDGETLVLTPALSSEEREKRSLLFGEYPRLDWCKRS
jgi:hypothetical protein